MVDIIVPARNEEKNIEKLLRKIPKKYNVIVVDDGSQDKTASLARRAGVKVVSLKKTRGKGFACLQGLKKTKSDKVVFIDGDGQLYPKDIDRLVPHLKKNDLVIGERRIAGIPFQRQLTNNFSRIIVNFITGLNFNDVLCGLRAANRKNFKKLKFKKLGYCFESEMLLEAVRLGLTIKSVPVNVNYKIGSRMSFWDSIDITLWFLWTLLDSTIKKMVIKCTNR